MSSPNEEDQQPQQGEDRAWMNNLDSRADNAASTEVDSEAVSKAMEALQTARGPPAAGAEATLSVRPNVKVDAADVALVVSIP